MAVIRMSIVRQFKVCARMVEQAIFLYVRVGVCLRNVAAQLLEAAPATWLGFSCLEAPRDLGFRRARCAAAMILDAAPQRLDRRPGLTPEECSSQRVGKRLLSGVHESLGHDFAPPKEK